MRDTRLSVAAVLTASSFITAIVCGGVRAVAADAYTDPATAAWFKGLTSAYTQNCCDQADCKLAVADYRDGRGGRSATAPEPGSRSRRRR